MCNRPFNKEYWLRKHMWTKHASKVPASVKPAEDAKPSPSSQNPAVDSDAPIKQEDLKQEDQDQDSVPTVFSCPVCNKTFNGQFGLDRHTKAKHNPKPQEGRINCKLCRKSFADDRALQQHHEDTHYQVCTYCKKVFATKAALEEHKRRSGHTERKTETAAAQSRRQKEKVSEPSPQRFKCDFCNSTFHHFDLLEQHGIRHNLWSDDGPVVVYKCDFCPKTFYSYDEVEEHMRTTYRFNSPNSWESDGQTDEEDYEEDYEDSDEEEAEESDEENNEESNEGNEESDKESVPDLVENTGKTSGAAIEDNTFNKEGENATESCPALLECEDCGDAEFYDFDSLYKHLEYFCRAPWARWMRVHMGKASPEHFPHFFECEFCPQVFHTYARLDDHQEFLSHGPYWDGSKRKKPLKKRYEGQCSANWEEHDPTLAYKCDECGETFRTTESFTSHSWSQHEIVLRHPNDHLERLPPADIPKVPEKTVKSGYRCAHCDEPFSSEDLLAKHWESTHDEVWSALFDHHKKKYNYKKNKIPCITCWGKFKPKSEMVLHVETGKCHSYLDTDVIKSATQKSDQSVVSRIYKSDGKFQCPECDHISLALSDLVYHAQSRECRLSIHKGPLVEFISEMRWRMIEEAFPSS